MDDDHLEEHPMDVGEGAFDELLTEELLRGIEIGRLFLRVAHVCVLSAFA
jgi:hypothetical protein